MTPEEINSLKEENQRLKDLLGEFLLVTEDLEKKGKTDWQQSTKEAGCIG